MYGNFLHVRIVSIAGEYGSRRGDIVVEDKQGINCPLALEVTNKKVDRKAPVEAGVYRND